MPAHPSLAPPSLSPPSNNPNSYEMMQRLTCDACKGKGAAQHGGGMAAGQRPPCRDPQNCLAAQRWKVVIADGEWACAGLGQGGRGRGGYGSTCSARMHGPALADAAWGPSLCAPANRAESHTLRTSNRPPDAAHTEAVVTAAKAARRAILLTGTPSLSRPYDLFRQARQPWCSCLLGRVLMLVHPRACLNLSNPFTPVHLAAAPHPAHAQVDALMPGLLGCSRVAFASAYCNRREVPLPGGTPTRRLRCLTSRPPPAHQLTRGPVHPGITPLHPSALSSTPLHVPLLLLPQACTPPASAARALMWAG